MARPAAGRRRSCSASLLDVLSVLLARTEGAARTPSSGRRTPTSCGSTWGRSSSSPPSSRSSRSRCGPPTSLVRKGAALARGASCDPAVPGRRACCSCWSATPTWAPCYASGPVHRPAVGRRACRCASSACILGIGLARRAALILIAGKRLPDGAHHRRSRDPEDLRRHLGRTRPSRAVGARRRRLVRRRARRGPAKVGVAAQRPQRLHLRGHRRGARRGRLPGGARAVRRAGLHGLRIARRFEDPFRRAGRRAASPSGWRARPSSTSAASSSCCPSPGSRCRSSPTAAPRWWSCSRRSACWPRSRVPNPTRPGAARPRPLASGTLAVGPRCRAADRRLASPTRRALPGSRATDQEEEQ